MRRRLVTLAAMSALAIALTASPALASPMLHFPFDATLQTPIACTSGNTYTFTGGEFKIIARDSRFAAHISAVRVTAVDQLNRPYLVLGAETYNDPAGRLTSKLMFVGRGRGIADSVNIVLRYDKEGNLFVAHVGGTCGF